MAAAPSTAPRPGLLATIEQRTGVTPTGVLVAGFGAATWAVAQVAGSGAMFMLAFGSLVVLVVSWVSGSRSKAIEASRHQLPSRVRIGQPVEAGMSLTPTRRVGSVVVEEALPPALGLPVRLPLPGAAAGETVEHPYTFAPRHRGVHAVGPLTVSWSDGFGLTRRTAELLPATEVIVHPRTEPVQDRVLSRAWEDPPVRPPVSRPWPQGFEFYGTREYSPGDDPRRIMWRATARVSGGDDGTDRLLVRESEQGITDQVLLVCDTSLAAHSPGDPSETFERSIEAIASLGVRHLEDGFTISVETGTTNVPGLRSRRDTVRLLDALARTDRGDEPLAGVLRRLIRGSRRNLHYVICAPDLDDEAATLIDLLSSRGSSVLFVLVPWEDTDPRAAHRAAAVGASVVELDPGVALEKAFHRIAGVGAKR